MGMRKKWQVMLVTPMVREPECGLLFTWEVWELSFSTSHNVHILGAERQAAQEEQGNCTKKKKEILVQINGYGVQSRKGSLEKEPMTDKCCPVCTRAGGNWPANRANYTGGIIFIKGTETWGRGMFRGHRKGGTALLETLGNKYRLHMEDYGVLHTSKKREAGQCYVRASLTCRLRQLWT